MKNSNSNVRFGLTVEPNKYVAIEFAQQQSYSGVATDVEAIRRIQEEEVKVQDRLREKAVILLLIIEHRIRGEAEEKVRGKKAVIRVLGKEGEVDQE